MFNEEEVIGANTWTIARTDCDGNLRTTTFKAEDWVTAMQEFVYFLKGNGFYFPNNSVRLNQDFLTDNWCGETFSTEDGFGL